MSTAPKLLHPPLISCREVERLCDGINGEGCGDAIDDPNDDLCRSHRREEDRIEQLRLLEAEGIYPEPDYPHLTNID